ncbi:hypothetical protein DMA11_18315 [Marinilabiliaceae bacterium JC017]|nr:hypothetical protein DMA11_18315 [Marinilabiliaceae bacterium JC017]
MREFRPVGWIKFIEEVGGSIYLTRPFCFFGQCQKVSSAWDNVPIKTITEELNHEPVILTPIWSKTIQELKTNPI